MPVIEVPAILRRYTDDKKEIEFDGKTVKEIIEKCLRHHHPELHEALFNVNGNFWMWILLNGERIKYNDERKLKKEDKISFLAPMTGG